MTIQRVVRVINRRGREYQHICCGFSYKSSAYGCWIGDFGHPRSERRSGAFGRNRTCKLAFGGLRDIHFTTKATKKTWLKAIFYIRTRVVNKGDGGRQVEKIRFSPVFLMKVDFIRLKR